MGALLPTAAAGLLVLQTHWLDELARAQRDDERRTLELAARSLGAEMTSVLATIARAVLENGDECDVTTIPWVRGIWRDGAAARLDTPSFTVGQQRWRVVIDPDRLRADLGPEVSVVLGSGGETEYRVRVTSLADGAAPWFDSHPRDSPPSPPPAAAHDIALLPLHVVGDLGGGTWVGEGQPLFVGTPRASSSAPMPAGDVLRVAVHRRGTSLDDAWAAARTRNMLLWGSLLLLLLVGLALFWIAEHRARRLAENQLQFLAGISHELRTPLAVARMAASNLACGAITGSARIGEYGRLIEGAVARLNTLVDRALRLSGPESARADYAPVDLAACLAEATRQCEPWREQRSFIIESQVEAPPRTVIGDAAALVSALHNLIENAVKYGDDGATIRIHTRQEAGQVAVVVANQGEPISPRDAARVFDPFFRASRARASGTGGHGIGLTVAARIAMAHGGTLRLEQDPEQRRIAFVLSLPLREPA